MKCRSCGGEDFQRPEVPSALEQWECLACGTKEYVHCNYLPSHAYLSKVSRHARFQGSVDIESDEMRLKAFLKLKHSFGFAERFSATALEGQYLNGSQHWDLGEFLDFEVERAEAECKKAGVSATFRKLAE